MPVTMTAKREVKAAQEMVKLGWFGLFVVLLGRFSTGSSISASRSHNLTLLTTLYHFVPHLTRKSLIVNNKLEGWHPTLGGIQQSARTCG
jgi:hypothetical protein